jgi:hypothetical protein
MMHPAYGRDVFGTHAPSLEQPRPDRLGPLQYRASIIEGSVVPGVPEHAAGGGGGVTLAYAFAGTAIVPPGSTVQLPPLEVSVVDPVPHALEMPHANARSPVPHDPAAGAQLQVQLFEDGGCFTSTAIGYPGGQAELCASVYATGVQPDGIVGLHA